MSEKAFRSYFIRHHDGYSILKMAKFDESTNKYESDSLCEYTQGFLDGSYRTFQDQQKQIDSQSECIKNLVAQKNNEFEKLQASLVLIDNFFDNQTQTPSNRQYANFIQEIYETLRGDK